MTDKDTLIEKYLYDELSEDEVQEFEQRMDTDADFADEVRLRSVIFAKTKSDFKILGVLASLLYYSFGEFSAGNSIDTYLAQTHPAPPTLMGENDDLAVWKAARDAYKKSDYEATIYEIEKIRFPDTEQQFYLGLAYLYNKNYDKSIAQFESIIQQNNINYSPASKWYISLAYLKNNEMPLFAFQRALSNAPISPSIL